MHAHVQIHRHTDKQTQSHKHRHGHTETQTYRHTTHTRTHAKHKLLLSNLKAIMLVIQVLEIIVGHFLTNFSILADQNLFWLAKFSVHSQWDRNQ